MNGNDDSDVDTNNTMVRQRCRIVDTIDDDDGDGGGDDDCELIDCGCCTVLVAVTECGGDDNVVVKS